MPYLFTALISIVASVSAFFGVYNYLPQDALTITGSPILGATITTIAGTDTLSASRTVINTNFSNLNTELGTVIGTTTNSTITTLSGLTTASALSSIGTITTGIWNGTVIGVAYNGTGTTSPTLNQVILGNGASGFKVVSGFGSSGQFLTSQGNATAPIWTTSAIDQAGTYNWTAHHTFTSLFATAASSTNATTTNLTVTGRIGTATYTASLPTAQASSTSVWEDDGTGTLTAVIPASVLAATTTNTNVANTATETAYGGTLGTLRGGTMGTGGGIEVKFHGNSYDTTPNTTWTFRFKLGGTTVCSITSPASSNFDFVASMRLYSNASASSQVCISEAFDESGTPEMVKNEETSAVNTAIDQAMTFTIQLSADDADDQQANIINMAVTSLGR